MIPASVRASPSPDWRGLSFIPLFRAENGDNKGDLLEYTKKTVLYIRNQSKVHKKPAAKKKFLGKVEKILKIFDFLIDFREKLSYNRGCMERETGPQVLLESGEWEC